MAQLLQRPLRFDTFEEFLDWERFQDVRHDLIDGVPVAMTGASEGHNIILGNIFAALLSKLRGGPCRPFTSDMAMKTGVRSGRYPDVSVDCGPRNPANRAAPHPVVVFEVLSPTTEGEDRTVKLSEYNDVSSIQSYVLVEQAEPLVYAYSRGQTGDFKLRPEDIRGLDALIDLPAIGTMLTLREVYEGLTFGTEPTSEPTPSPWAG